MDNNVDYNWYFHVWKNYGKFEGRASRKEYWNFVLFNFLITLILTLISAGVLSVIYMILVIIPSVAVAVRRLHDVGKSGWMLLASLVPIIGTIYLLYLLCIEGNGAGDEYGYSAPDYPYED